MEHSATLQFFLFLPLAFTNKPTEFDILTKERKWHVCLQQEGSWLQDQDVLSSVIVLW